MYTNSRGGDLVFLPVGPRSMLHESLVTYCVTHTYYAGGGGNNCERIEFRTPPKEAKVDVFLEV